MVWILLKTKNSTKSGQIYFLGCGIKSVSPLPSVALQSSQTFRTSDDDSSLKVFRQPSCHVDDRQISPIFEESSLHEFVPALNRKQDDKTFLLLQLAL